MVNKLFNTDVTVSGIVDATQVRAATSLTVSGIPVATSADVTYLQSQIDNLPTSSGSSALIGTDGITIISGSNTTTIQGFRSEFLAASGSLQTQINTFSGTSASFINQTNVVLTHNFNTLIYTTTVIDPGGSVVEGSVQQTLNAVTVGFNQGQSGTIIVTR